MKFSYRVKFRICFYEKSEIMPPGNFISPLMCNYLKEFIAETKMKPEWNLMVYVESLP